MAKMGKTLKMVKNGQKMVKKGLKMTPKWPEKRLQKWLKMTPKMTKNRKILINKSTDILMIKIN